MYICHYTVKLFLDLISWRFCCKPFNIVDICPATIFKGPKGVPGGVETNVEQIVINASKFTNNWFNKVTVLFPNNKGSVAFLEPNLIKGDPTIKFALVSKLNPLTELNPIVWAELSNKWSWVVLNTNRPEFRITCLPAYWSGDVGDVW